MNLRQGVARCFLFGRDEQEQVVRLRRYLLAARTAFLLIYPMIMFFGVFGLGTRALLLVGAFIMCAYALVVRLMGEQPARLDPPAVELLRGLVLATVLVWFSFMGGYVHELR